MSAPIYTPFVVSSTSCVRSKSAKASAGVTVGGQQGLSYGAVLNAEHMQHSHTPSSLCNTIHDRSIRPAKTQNGNGEWSAYEPESARIRPWEGRMKKPRQVNGASGTTVDMDTVCGYRGTNGLGDQDDIVDVEGVEEPPIGRVTEGSSRYLAGPLAEESPPISNAQRRTQVTRLRAKLLDAQNELKKLRQCEYRWARTDDENKYLKEELELAYSRIRELEALLLHRNAKLKNVLSENLMKTVKLNRLKAEVGEDVFEMC
ncbi:unnamed protein product [Toxocara canis]|uniref:BZIP domain-containing protein n=1 Tax=Toxocara canis TaxID=6265 RepID=A0A183UKH4_TOXCA|nr:unnamed protein product [Toxocara canis]